MIGDDARRTTVKALSLRGCGGRSDFLTAPPAESAGAIPAVRREWYRHRTRLYDNRNKTWEMRV